MKETKKDVIKLTVPSKGEYLSLIRLTVSSVAARMGFNIDDIDDIKVSIGEACTNIMENLNPEEDNEFKIKYIADRDKLKIKISTKGKGYPKSKLEESKLEEIQDLSETLDDGLGMMIIKSLMDSVKISNIDGNGTEIKMIKYKRDEHYE